MWIEWRCEGCKRSGSVQHRKDAGVTEVRNLLIFAHRRRDESCHQRDGIAKVRVITKGKEVKS